ncbi:MAG TPA: tetratricopeptide repeat protein [Gemmatales bacterium]|nr:tetratricopeptide repeat protein [Gemmatales bacterium]
MKPRQRPRYRGWLAPVYRLRDSALDMWDSLTRMSARVFNFRWLSNTLSQWVQYLWWAVRYPFYVLSWLLGQLWSVMVAWWQIRNFRFLIQGLPALIGIIFIVVVTAYTYLRADDGLQEMYSRQAFDARMRLDRSKARLCYERLMQLQYVGDPRRLETQFALGQLSDELGQKHRAVSLLQELANPDNDEGLPDAHLARARAIFQNSRRQKEDLLLIEKHLRRALKKQPDNQAVNGELGKIMAMQGRVDEALPFLLKSKNDDTDARLTLAKIYKMQGNTQQANMFLEPLIDYLKNHASGEIDDVRYRSTLANAYMHMDEFENAIKVLEAGYNLKKSDFFKTYLSNCYMRWYIQQSALPVTPERERLKLTCLIHSLEWDNTNVQSMNLFVKYMNNTGSDTNERKEAHKLLMALRGNNAYLHLWLGDTLIAEGKMEEASKEWDMAFKLNPDSSIIANNFAWMLTQGHTFQNSVVAPDLLKAERIITQVINRTLPEDRNKPWFYGTRGTVYLKMGRFEEARADLVAASQRPGAINDYNLQKQLAEVHDRLKMPTVADAHRKLMAEIIKRNSRTEPGEQQ